MTIENGLYEFETKYRVTDKFLHDFKNIVHPHAGKFFYAESNDIFYTNDMPDRFMRHRIADSKYSEKMNQLTLKIKTQKTNNYKRVEINLDILNSPEQVQVFCEGAGFKRNTSIFKYTHVYHVENAVLAYYTVRDEAGELSHFVEIEADQNLVDKEAWDVIKLWEDRLQLKANERLKKSLFEMYRK